MTTEEASYILRKFYADGYKSNNYSSLEQALQLAVECLENSPHWTSVDVELPKKEGWFLVVQDDEVDMWKYEGETAIVLKDVYHVTHWMPLPQEPKEGGEV